MDTFLQYLNHPDDPATALTRQRLHELIRRYPWFTTARIVLSRMDGTVDPVLALRLMSHPAPDLLLRGGEAAFAECPEVEMPSAELCGSPATSSGLSVEPCEVPAETAELPVEPCGAPEEPCELLAERVDPMIEVIDRFLALPQVRIVPKEDTPEGNLAAVSAMGEAADDDLVSEELAEIYLAQGLATGAKEIYSKLSLLYPEKSVYFAEIISRIERETAG